MKKLLLLTVALAFIGTAGANAAVVIWSNPITDATPNVYNPFVIGDVVVPDLTVSGIGRGSGISGNAGGNRYNATNWTLGGLDANDYFTFTLTPAAGFELDLESFVYTGQRSGTGPNSFAFRSSLDGFTSDITSPSATGGTIDLSAYQNLTGPIEFRFYGYAAGGAAGTFSINDFSFTGDLVAVPEPSTYALIGLGLGGLVVLRRMKKISVA